MNRTEQNQHFDVGGQAVMEGVMMRSPTATAVTVRRPDGTMVTKLSPFVPLKQKQAFLWDLNENGPFPVLWRLLSFPNLLAYCVAEGAAKQLLAKAMVLKHSGKYFFALL